MFVDLRDHFALPKAVNDFSSLIHSFTNNCVLFQTAFKTQSKTILSTNKCVARAVDDEAVGLVFYSSAAASASTPAMASWNCRCRDAGPRPRFRQRRLLGQVDWLPWLWCARAVLTTAGKKRRNDASLEPH